MDYIRSNKIINENIWEKDWLDEILDQNDKGVKSWPFWMQKPELRYQLSKKEKKMPVLHYTKDRTLTCQAKDKLDDLLADPMVASFTMTFDKEKSQAKFVYNISTVEGPVHKVDTFYQEIKE